MIKRNEITQFYKNKRILITGHTGFKGTWLCKILSEVGAIVSGYALAPPMFPNLFELSDMENKIHSYIGDICDLKFLTDVFEKEQPEIVIHMAAQPLVRESYKKPVETYEVNVMGTVNILECIRRSSSVKSFVNVTTDKVYRNNEWDKGYIETDYLDGYDPYSNSKSCSELVTHSYAQSFLMEQGVSVSTCRAGNVIGGGDFAADRIVPDCIRAALRREDICVRNPYSTRPYQHVLEPLFAYLIVAMRQYENLQFAGNYNVGPEDESCITTGQLVTLFCDEWNKQVPESKLKWVNQSDGGPHEANYLKLDCTKLRNTFDWSPRWPINLAIEKVVEYEKLRLDNSANTFMRLCNCMEHQINEYLRDDC